MSGARREAIIRLLRTRDEHLPLPVHRSEASAGFVHRVKVPVSCPDCLANDGQGNRFDCETCGGSRFVEEWRERDPYAMNEVVAYGLDGSRHDAARARDRQIDVLAQQIRPASSVDELEDANAHPFGWEVARKRMYREFDYGPLDVALEQLRVVDDAASRALHGVYVYAWQPEPSAGPLQIACARGLAFLSEWLPDPLRAPAPEPPVRVVGRVARGAGEQARATRDARIRELAAAGSAPREIAVECRVSIRTVYDVVRVAAA